MKKWLADEKGLLHTCRDITNNTIDELEPIISTRCWHVPGCHERIEDEKMPKDAIIESRKRGSSPQVKCRSEEIISMIVVEMKGICFFGYAIVRSWSCCN